MITARVFSGKRYAVFGLARTGLATARALIASGADVLGWDDGDAARRAAAEAGIPLVDLYALDLRGLDGLLLSPGIPLYLPAPHPLAEKARLAGVPVIGDVELFARARAELPAHKVVAITGTNGKSTTTALIHHVVAAAGVPTRMGGNIGLPILGEAPLPEGGVYVLELSSFQIDLTQTLVADVAVLTNITPDHLDRHGDMAGYTHAKQRLFAMQTPRQTAVVSIDDDPSRRIADTVAGTLVPISNERVLGHGVCVVGGTLNVDGRAIGSQSAWPRLQGPHNAQNAAAAYAACRALGIADAVILAAFASYPGLAHRMEFVAEIGGVTYLNDSKATNPTSTAPALAAYPAIHWIAGGKAKTDELDACLPHLGHVRQAYVIGAAEALFAGLLSPHVPVVRAGTLEQAVADAAAAARPGEVVLLSPACASYDQFRDFEARGDAFRAAVAALGQGDAS
ncbi:UDP-N-acetylmuramoyl-L-alanine--D-glutamate ligase [Parapedomonas caeni]